MVLTPAVRPRARRHAAGLHMSLIEVKVAFARRAQHGGIGQSGPESSIMCLGVPMRIMAIDGFVARCEAKGIERNVNLFLLQHEVMAPGDYVMVHVGYAIQKMSAADAATTWELLDRMLTEEELLGNA